MMARLHLPSLFYKFLWVHVRVSTVQANSPTRLSYPVPPLQIVIRDPDLTVYVIFYTSFPEALKHYFSQTINHLRERFNCFCASKSL